MRHQRAKAARKTLQHFARSVNLKSKPYYSVLLDATFLIAMIRITASGNTTSSNDTGNESTLVSRIERVLQVNTMHHGGGRDERLSGVVGDNHRNWNETPEQSNNNNNNNNNNHRFNRYNVRYFIPQEAVDEIETILKTFQDRSEKTKHKKKQKKYAAKAKVFEDALSWIKSHKSKKRNLPSSGRCEVLPRLEALIEPPPTKKQKAKIKQQQQQESEEAAEDNNSNDELPGIGASDAVRRHIARDDGREDPETNRTIIIQKQQQQQGSVSFSRTYIVASQEEDLLDDLRMLGTVPILRCANNASVLILEHPSKKGQRTDTAKEHSKWKGALQNPAEKALVDAAWEAQKKHKVKIRGIENNSTEQQTKRGQANKAKGPNPLSCKRKRTEKQPKQSGESKSMKRRARAHRNKEALESSASGAAVVSAKE